MQKGPAIQLTNIFFRLAVVSDILYVQSFCLLIMCSHWYSEAEPFFKKLNECVACSKQGIHKLDKPLTLQSAIIIMTIYFTETSPHKKKLIKAKSYQGNKTSIFGKHGLGRESY